MNISRKLRLAALCLAVAGMTVACTNDDDPIPAAPAVKESQKKKDKDKKKPEEEKEDPVLKAQQEKIEARKVISDQLLLLASSDEKCDRTDEILEKAWVNKTMISKTSTVQTVRQAVRVLGEKLALEADPACRMAAIAKTSRKMHSHYVNNPAVDFMSKEDSDNRFAILESYLTALQPIVEKVKGSLALRDYVNQPIFSIAQRLEGAQARIDGLKDSMEGLQTKARNMCSDYTSKACSDKVTGALNYVAVAKKSVDSYQTSLDEVVEVQNAKVGKSVVDAMLADIEKRISLEEGNIADVRKNLDAE